jgi:hypothetical protein
MQQRTATKGWTQKHAPLHRCCPLSLQHRRRASTHLPSRHFLKILLQPLQLLRTLQQRHCHAARAKTPRPPHPAASRVRVGRKQSAEQHGSKHVRRRHCHTLNQAAPPASQPACQPASQLDPPRHPKHAGHTPVHVRGCLSRQLQIDDKVHPLQINTPGNQVCSHCHPQPVAGHQQQGAGKAVKSRRRAENCAMLHAVRWATAIHALRCATTLHADALHAEHSTSRAELRHCLA